MDNDKANQDSTLVSALRILARDIDSEDADVKGCIRAIESIYPSIGKAMYDEPRDRLAFKVNLLIQAILAEDRQAAQKQLKRLKPNRDRCHFCLGWIEKGKQHVCGYK